MQNLDEAADLQEWDAAAEAGIVGIATDHVRTHFTSADVHLFSVPSAAGQCDNPLFPLEPPNRGIPSLCRKGDIVYPSENPAAIDVKLETIFSPFRPEVHWLQFHSIYTEHAREQEEAVPSQLRRTVSVKPTQLPAFRHERVVKHPVSIGCMKRSGMKEATSTKFAKSPWVLYWGPRWKDERDFCAYASEPQVRINHFPKTFLIGRKDNLARQLRKAYGASQRLMPMTYILPVDLPLLKRDAAKGAQLFIVKPSASSRGRGIQLFQGPEIPDFLMKVTSTVKDQKREKKLVEKSDDESSSISEDEDDCDLENDEVIVQRYIERPLLINGYKVDLRVYCLVTSFDPLRAYVFNDGLVRFATAPYNDICTRKEGHHNSPEDFAFRHLTNYSVNKNNSKAYVKTNDASGDGTGSKWSLHALKKFLEANAADGKPKLSWDQIWRNVTNCVVRTLISVEGEVASAVNNLLRHRNTCFELFGFDILLDESFQAHLIEVNVLPSLACGSALDKHIKGNLVADILTLVGISAPTSSAPKQEFNIKVSPPPVLHQDVKQLPFGSSTIRQLGNAGDSASPKSDWVARLRKNPSAFFATLDVAERQLIVDAEEELLRSGGFQRIIPGFDTEPTFGACFATPVKYSNLLLWEWEKQKRTFSDIERQLAVEWLRGAMPYPRAPPRPPSPPKQKKTKPAKTVPPPQESPPTLPALPRVASLRSKSPRSKHAGDGIREKAPLHVATFSFVPVPQRK